MLGADRRTLCFEEWTMALVTDDRQCRTEEAPSAWVEDGVLRIRDTGKPVPRFLTEANEALIHGQTDTAVGLLTDTNIIGVEQIIQEDPSRVELMYMTAKLFLALERLDEAEVWCRRIVDAEPSAVAHHQMAYVYSRHLGKMSRSLEHARQAVEMEPGNVSFHMTHAEALLALGRTDEGIVALQEAVRRFPREDTVLAGLLCHLHYLPKGSRELFYDGYRQWARIATTGIRPRERHRNDPDPDRRLRIGFISPDLRRNSATISFEPLLDTCDRSQWEVFAYADVARPDSVTQRLRGKFDVFREIHGRPAHEVADSVEADGIDILVEIGGHVRDNGLMVCAYKPAPVQVDYGGVSTTGLEQIDYRLTDSIIDPPETLRYYVEQSVYLPGGLACLRPPLSSPFVGPLPAKANGFVTFGSFNRHMKITDQQLGLWAEILKALPTSRLLMKFHAGNDPVLRDIYLGKFQSLGIDPDRIRIHGTLPDLEYLELIGQVDIALDAYPFNGCITTLEGLWMGVPIVTQTGDTYTSRVGLSILSRLGLEVFSATSPQEYVAKACAFASQIEALERIRLALRPLLLQSPLCDPVRWARQIEQAFRTMWRTWCGHQKSKAGSQKPEVGTQNSELRTQEPEGGR